MQKYVPYSWMRPIFSNFNVITLKGKFGDNWKNLALVLFLILYQKKKIQKEKNKVFSESRINIPHFIRASKMNKRLK